MSSQKDGFLQTTQSFKYNRDVVGNYRVNSINSSKFNDWQKDYMYRSTYSQYHSKDSVEPRVSSIPKYGGYIPYVKPENIHAKSYTPVTKECFSNQKLAKNILGLATNGFNVSRDAFIDKSKFASSSKYGKTSIQAPHPAWRLDAQRSTTHDFYRDPAAQVNPTFRQTDKFLQTHSAASKSSGFATNNGELDGKGWEQSKTVAGDMRRSEYRDRFNAPVVFHRDTYLQRTRKLPEKQLNYKFN